MFVIDLKMLSGINCFFHSLPASLYSLFFILCLYFLISQLLFCAATVNATENKRIKNKSSGQYSRSSFNYHKRPDIHAKYFRFLKRFYFFPLFSSSFTVDLRSILLLAAPISKLIVHQANCFVVEHSITARVKSIPRVVFHNVKI